MLSKKKVSILALAGLAAILAGCGNSKTETTAPAPVNTDTTPTPVLTTSGYPEATLRLKTSSYEIEVGGKATVKAIVNGDVTNYGADFTVSDPTIFSIAPNEKGTSVEVTGLKEGTAKLIATVKDNPTVTKQLTITVIAAKPTLRKAFENIANLKNYTLQAGNDLGEGTSFTPKTFTKVVDGTVISYDSTGKAIAHESVDLMTTRDYYGVTVLPGSDKAVYLAKESGSVMTTAPLVRGVYGFVDKANLSGYSDKAIGVDDNPFVYGLRAINPQWLSDEKTEDNIYEIDGGKKDDRGLSTNPKAAVVETLLWRLVDPTSYDKEVSALNDNFCTEVAADVQTSIQVTGENTVEINITVGKNSYKAVMTDIGTTKLTGDANYTQFASVVGATDLLADDLEDGIKALNTHNYVMNNFMYPDHKTEFHYSTYFTPNYVYYDCNAAFKAEYNQKVSDPADTWTKDPYGYAKKADGVYKFTYVDGSIHWETTKEANTDANTSIYDLYYVEAQEFMKEPLVYAFADTAKTIWNAETVEYHMTRSAYVTEQLIDFYAPEDGVETFDKAISGIGVVYDETDKTKVTTMNFTAGFEPFIDETASSDHNYGVDRFVISDFGSAKTNDVDALLGL